MGKIKRPEKVKLFCGILGVSVEFIKAAEKELMSNYGNIDARSDIIPFTFTRYYNNEMGDKILREWVGFEKLVEASEIAKIKVMTNRIEEKSMNEKRRQINLDPGYLTPAKIILATTKDYSHRIYLAKGIFAEVTLQYQDKSFIFLPWTYPDYKTKEAIKFFGNLRQKYKNPTKIKQK